MIMLWGKGEAGWSSYTNPVDDARYAIKCMTARLERRMNRLEIVERNSDDSDITPEVVERRRGHLRNALAMSDRLLQMKEEEKSSTEA